MMSLMKIFANRDLMKFINKMEKMKNPEFKVSEFELDGKKWIGLLVRDKNEGEQSTSPEPASQENKE